MIIHRNHIWKIDRETDLILRNLYRHDIYCYYRILPLYDY